MNRQTNLLNPVIEGLSPQQLIALQAERAIAQLGRMYTQSPFYRQLYDSVGCDPSQIRTIEDFYAHVPFIEKPDLLRDQAAYPPFGSRIAEGIPIRQIFFTSGTSGATQEVHPASEEDLESVGTSTSYTWNMVGVLPGDKMFITLPFGINGVGAYFGAASAAYGTILLVAGSAGTEQKLALMQRLQPDVLVLSPSYLFRLTVAARQLNIRPKYDLRSVRIILLNSESFSIAWAAEMTEFWDASLEEYYGSTQTGGNTMATCRGAIVQTGSGFGHGVLHNLDHRNLIEVRDPETGRLVEPGDEGEVIVTNLHRRLFPCIRFRMHDKVRYLGVGVCECGLPFSAYESGTIGRYDDMLKIKGVNVWPDAVDRILFDGSRIQEYRALVDSMPGSGSETVTIEFETLSSEDLDPSWIEGLASQIRREIGFSATLVHVPANSLPRFDSKPRRWIDGRRLSQEPTTS
jgi:phenylacetate-CoA ligase